MMKTCQDMLREVADADRMLTSLHTFEERFVYENALASLDRALVDYPAMMDNLLRAVHHARGVAVAALGAAKFAADHRTPEAFEVDGCDPLELSLHNDAMGLIERCWVVLGGKSC